MVHVRIQIDLFLRGRLHLTLHPTKTRIERAEFGVLFLGCMVVPFREYVSTRTVKRFHVKINMLERKCLQSDMPTAEELMHMRSVINSYLGHFMHFKAHNILEDTFEGSPLLQYFTIDKDYRKCVISVPEEEWVYEEL